MDRVVLNWIRRRRKRTKGNLCSSKSRETFVSLPLGEISTSRGREKERRPWKDLFPDDFQSRVRFTSPRGSLEPWQNMVAKNHSARLPQACTNYDCAIELLTGNCEVILADETCYWRNNCILLSIKVRNNYSL